MPPLSDVPQEITVRSRPFIADSILRASGAVMSPDFHLHIILDIVRSENSFFVVLEIREYLRVVHETECCFYF